MMEVEISRRIVDCVNKDRADTHDIRRAGNAGEGVAKQGLTQPFSMLAPVHGKARKQNDTDRMVSDPLSNSFWGLVLEHRAGDKRVIADDSTAAVSNVSFRGFRPLVRPGEPCQPIVQSRV